MKYQKQERYFHIVCPMVICLVANIIAVSTLNTAARCKFKKQRMTKIVFPETQRTLT